MSSSSDRRLRPPSQAAASQGAVLPRDQVRDVTSLPTPELRAGTWTRHGDGALLGDPVAESVLGQVAEQARAAAEAQGYSVGWAQGRRQAEEEAAAAARETAQRTAEAEARREAEHRAAIAALAQAAVDVRATLEGLAARIEQQATTLAWELTEALVGREVQVASSADVISRVLQALPTDGLATVRLHPDHVADDADDAVQSLREAGLTVVADPNLGRGDALVECDGSVADLRISEALERVRRVLA